MPCVMTRVLRSTRMLIRFPKTRRSRGIMASNAAGDQQEDWQTAPIRIESSRVCRFAKSFGDPGEEQHRRRAEAEDDPASSASRPARCEAKSERHQQDGG